MTNTRKKKKETVLYSKGSRWCQTIKTKSPVFCSLKTVGMSIPETVSSLVWAAQHWLDNSTRTSMQYLKMKDMDSDISEMMEPTFVISLWKTQPFPFSLWVPEEASQTLSPLCHKWPGASHTSALPAPSVNKDKTSVLQGVTLMFTGTDAIHWIAAAGNGKNSSFTSFLCRPQSKK